MTAAAPLLCFLEIDAVLRRSSPAAVAKAASYFATMDVRNIAPILCTGSTRNELNHLTRALGIWHPFVAEDGSAVCVPSGYFGAPIPEARPGYWWDVLEFGRARRTVLETITAEADRCGVEVSFLSRSRNSPPARRLGVRATKRLYGEVIRVVSSNEFNNARLLRALRAAHLRCTSRENGVYVVPDHGGNVAAVTLRDLYQQHYRQVTAVDVIDTDGAGIAPSVCELTMQVDASALDDVARQALAACEQFRRRHGHAVH